MRFFILLLLLPFTVMAAEPPSCVDPDVIKSVKQHYKSVIISKMVSLNEPTNSKKVEELSNTLTEINFKLYDVGDVALRNESGVRICKADLIFYIQNAAKDKIKIIYMVEPDSTSKSKFKVQTTYL